MKRALSIAALCGLAVAGAAAQQWPQPAGDQGASHYSPLEQITPANVNQLQVAWEWRPNEKDLPQFGTRPGAFQASPIVVDNAALRERLRLPPGDPAAAPLLAHAPGEPADPTGWLDASTVPTAGAPPAADQPDRTIYDTARRIWRRLAH